MIVLDDLRSYLQMASGLTEATTAKARDVVTSLLATGVSLTSKAVPNTDVVEQVQELADDLVTTSRNNREMLVAMIRAEVDRAVGRMGFVREDELAALRRHVQRLERQLADLEAARPAPESAETVVEVLVEPVVIPDVESVVGDVVMESGEFAVNEVHDAAAEAADSPEAAESAAPKKKKKKIILDDGA